MKRGLWVFGTALTLIGGLVAGRLAAEQDGLLPGKNAAAPSNGISPGADVVRLTDCNVGWLYNVSQHFKIPGVISGLEMSKEGTRVKKGEEICRLDDREARLQETIAQKKAEDNTDILVNTAQWHVSLEEFKDADTLRRRNQSWVSKEEWSLKAAKVDVAKYQIEQARMKQVIAGLDSDLATLKVEDHILRAPFDGIITEVLKQEGEYVDPQASGPVVRISKIDVLQVEGKVKVREGFKVQVGQPVVVTVSPEVSEVFRGQSFPGKVRFIEQEVEPVSQTMRVRAEVRNPNGLLRPGLPADMAIYISGQPEESHAARETNLSR